MRYADPLAQAEIDRLRAQLRMSGQDEAHLAARLVSSRKAGDQLVGEIEALEQEVARLRACSDPTPPAGGERHTAEQLWHHLLEASSHRRMYVLNQFLEAQDDANRCFLMNHESRLAAAETAHTEDSPTCDSCGRWTDRHPWLWCKTPTAHTGPR